MASPWNPNPIFICQLVVLGFWLGDAICKSCLKKEHAKNRLSWRTSSCAELDLQWTAQPAQPTQQTEMYMSEFREELQVTYFKLYIYIYVFLKWYWKSGQNSRKH